MAEFILSPVIDNLVTLLKDEVSMLMGVEDEVETLSQTLLVIQTYISDAECKQSTDEAVKRWLKQLKDVAYRAEDIVDHLAFKQLEEAVSAPKKQVRNIKFLSPCACFKQLCTLHHTGTGIKQINKDLQNILDLGIKLNLSSKVVEKSVITVRRPQTGSLVSEPKVYGRDEDKEKLMNMLMSPSTGQSGVAQAHNVSVIAIVGMGGVGKTTLAQLIYRDVKSFDQNLWICVSEEFDEIKIIQAIIESITSVKCELSQMSSLQKKLQESLRGKRYLLVMDDVWNEDSEKWNRVEATLDQCGAPGSKVLVTARSHQVAHAMGIMEPYTLKGLQDDDCWSLFKQRAFAVGEPENPKLVEIGREVADMCGGIPLVAKVLGTLFYSNREESYWLRIKNNGISSIPSGEKDILSVLRLSYKQLLSQLKRCFVYCSLFPKDTEIDVEDLTMQWMAHGLIVQRSDVPMEETAIEYSLELLWRSFFECADDDKCKMHDIVHDLAQSIAGEDYMVITGSESAEVTLPKPMHHINLHDYTVPKSFDELNNLRTLLIDQVNPDMNLNQMLSSVMRLRVLKICNGEVDLPNSTYKLIHLRYLYLHKVKDDILPNSICNLLNLQTLRVESRVIEFPRDTSRLKRLRHLIYGDSPQPECSPPNIGQLTNLRTLREFIVAKDEGCKIDALGGLRHLGGNLTIRNLENVANGNEAELAKLTEKQHLKQLSLVWSRGIQMENTEQVLEGLHPCQNLKALLIGDYPGERLPSWWIESSLPFLAALSLIRWDRYKMPQLPLHFPSLESVELCYMDAFKCLELSLDRCPSLKVLFLRSMDNLESLTQVDGDHSVPCLRELTI